jgi:hypothetical protein
MHILHDHDLCMIIYSFDYPRDASTCLWINIIFLRRFPRLVPQQDPCPYHHLPTTHYYAVPLLSRKLRLQVPSANHNPTPDHPVPLLPWKHWLQMPSANHNPTPDHPVPLLPWKLRLQVPSANHNPTNHNPTPDHPVPLLSRKHWLQVPSANHNPTNHNPTNHSGLRLHPTPNHSPSTNTKDDPNWAPRSLWR